MQVLPRFGLHLPGLMAENACHGMSCRFGEDVMDTMVAWTAGLLRRHSSSDCAPLDAAILDVGTGNGVLPLQLARQGYINVTGARHLPASLQTSLSMVCMLAWS